VSGAEARIPRREPRLPHLVEASKQRRDCEAGDDEAIGYRRYVTTALVAGDASYLAGVAARVDRLLAAPASGGAAGRRPAS